MNPQNRKKKSVKRKRQKKQLKECNVEPGMKGFFCAFWNDYEEECIREAYNVLSEFADNLYGPETKSSQTSDVKALAAKKPSGNRRKKKTEIGDKENKEEKENIFTASKEEAASLKAESKNSFSSNRFQVVDTGVECVVFIRTTVPNPLELASTIVRQVDETKKQQFKFLMRLLPVELVCEANINDIKLKVDPLLGKYFTQEPKTFAIAFSLHSVSNLKRKLVVDELFDIIVKKNPGNTPNLLYPDIGVVVEVVCEVCLISIAPQYYTYKKYDMREICKVTEPVSEESAHAARLLIAALKRKREEKESAKKVEPARDSKIFAESEMASENK